MDYVYTIYQTYTFRPSKHSSSQNGPQSEKKNQNKTKAWMIKESLFILWKKRKVSLFYD